MSRTPTPVRRGLPTAAPGLPVPADKRFRRSEVRQGRRRNWRSWWFKAAWLGGAALLAIVVVVSLAGALADARVFKVSHVALTGNVQLTDADVNALLAGLTDESILRVKLAQYRLRLLASPWIASAELSRLLPSTVQVRIVERRPLFAARLHGQLYLVDAAGVIIDRFGPQYRQFDLPIVDGLLNETEAGPAVDAARLGLAQRFIREVSGRADWLSRISQLNVSNPRNAVVLIQGEPAELRLGDEKFLARLDFWKDVADSTRAQMKVEEYWDLRSDDETIVVK
jgi:cell division septal protein FtsQ